MKLKITWKLIIYFIVLALSLAPAVLVNTLVGYIPALLVLFTGLLCLIWILVLKHSLEFDVESESLSCIRGDESPFRVFAANRSILPAMGLRIVFFISDDEGVNLQNEDLYLSLLPKQTRSFGFNAGFSHIGAYKAGTKKIEISDPLGIFRAVRDEERSYTLEILPQIITVNDLPVKTNVHTETVRTKLQAPLSGSDYTGVREYSFGDPMKTIHWKLSAHSGSLMTKQTESYSNTGVSVVLDMSVPESDGADRLDEFDAVIEAGVAAGNYAARNGLDYDMLFYKRDGSAARHVPASFQSLNGIVKDFHMTVPGEGNRVDRLIEKECRGAYAQANIVVCTTHADEALVTTLAGMRQRDLNPILVLVLSSNLTEREREARMSSLRQLQYFSIPCRVIEKARELEV